MTDTIAFPIEPLNAAIEALTLIRDHVARVSVDGRISEDAAVALLIALRGMDGLSAAFAALAAAVQKKGE